jgi:hypothetical protein
MTPPVEALYGLLENIQEGESVFIRLKNREIGIAF